MPKNNRPRLFTAEFKSMDGQRLISQMAFEFAAIISEVYGKKGEDVNF